MSQTFDFDRVIDRHNTDCEKYDGRERLFGHPDLTPLWVADMDFAAPPPVLAALQQRLDHGVLGYSQASDNLFQTITNWCQQRLNWSLAGQHLLLCPGVVPSLYACVQAFSQPGDGIIVQPPVYPLLFTAATTNDRKLLLNPLLEHDGHYQMDFDGLEQLAPHAKMLLLCSPHNPVGRVWTAAELQRLLAIAERHDLLIVSDEIHADLVFAPHQHTVMASLPDAGQRVITAMAPSKTFNIPGLGLSWLALPSASQRDAVNAAFAKLHISMSNPISLVATEAAYGHGHDWLTQLMAYLAQTRDEVLALLAPTPIRVSELQATYLLWLDFRAFGLSEADMMQRLIHQANVGLSAGSWFGEAGHGFLRLNMAAPRALVLAAVERIISTTATLNIRTAP
ncbi:MAG: PatB family C-S lyase [Moraxellaceae bacterium]|nr:PatB family C-S lyase [Moraxellaceae bacterium]